jgi:hypothetical protein
VKLILKPYILLFSAASGSSVSARESELAEPEGDEQA